MNAVGIIVEYNPFHKGHALHLETVKEKFPEEVLIAVMSGDYVQRGEPALLSKERRAQKAKEMGVDIVIELPAFYSTQSAEIFAKASVGMLDKMNCRAVIFGSETNDIPRLEKIARCSMTKEFDLALKEYLAQGYSYPTSFSKALFEEKIESNDILGLEYIKAIWFWKSSMRAESILRKNVKYYEENIEKRIAGATVIRNKIKKREEYKQYLCNEEELQGPFLFWEDFYPYFRYYLLFHATHLEEIQDMEEGLEQRIQKAAKEQQDYFSFLQAVLTKRYTHARLQRVFLHILLGLSKEMTKKYKEKIPYLRVLEFSEKGQRYLKQIKKQERSMITTKKNIQKKLSKEAQEIFFWNEKASALYQWMIEEKA